MCIAGAIVRDTVFSKVEQFFTVVERTTCFNTAVALCSILRKDAVIVCGSGLKGLQTIQREAARLDLAIQATSPSEVRITAGSQKLIVLAETDAAESKTSTLYVTAPLAA